MNYILIGLKTVPSGLSLIWVGGIFYAPVGKAKNCNPSILNNSVTSY